MNSKTIQPTSSGLSYEIFGNGEQIWFAFHGFGQSAKAFQQLCTPKRTIYSFNLFFHHPMAQVFSLVDWKIEMEQFINKLQATQLYIVGFSIGCRSALQVANSLEGEKIRINKLILIAPEVLAVSNWYRLATETKIGEILLTMLPKSVFLQNTLIYCSKKLFNPSTYQLIKYQIRNRMDLVAKTWLAYKDFELHQDQLQRLSQRTTITVVASEEDKLISFSRLQKNCAPFSMTWKIINVPHERLLSHAVQIV